MPIKVKELRLSLVWTKSFSKDSLMPYFSDSGRYKQEFNKTQLGKSDWSLPWLPGERQHFWQYYLRASEIGDLDKVDADRAWDLLMPLRASTWAQIDTKNNRHSNDMRISLEGFCFPHSVGVIATFFILPTKIETLFDIVQYAIEARYDQYNITWRDNNSEPAHGSIDDLANGLIDRLHQKVLGSTPHGRRLSSPVTIATVVDATGVWALKSEKEAKNIDRALFGFCQLKPSWKRSSMKELVDDTGSPISNNLDPTEDRLYAMEHGRAIWLPYHFSDAPKHSKENKYKPRTRALGCYHRNLTLATLQTKSLTALAVRAYEYLPNEKISFLISNPVRKAIQALNNLYDGDMQTYRSWSLKHQISYTIDIIKKVGEAVGYKWIEIGEGPSEEEWAEIEKNLETNEKIESDDPSDFPF